MSEATHLTSTVIPGLTSDESEILNAVTGFLQTEWSLQRLNLIFADPVTASARKLITEQVCKVLLTRSDLRRVPEASSIATPQRDEECYLEYTADLSHPQRVVLSWESEQILTLTCGAREKP